jgi:hypothetical protein
MLVPSSVTELIETQRRLIRILMLRFYKFLARAIRVHKDVAT